MTMPGIEFLLRYLTGVTANLFGESLTYTLHFSCLRNVWIDSLVDFGRNTARIVITVPEAIKQITYRTFSRVVDVS